MILSVIFLFSLCLGIIAVTGSEYSRRPYRVRQRFDPYSISSIPSLAPSVSPSSSPTYVFTESPSVSPSLSIEPSEIPTEVPTSIPTTRRPTIRPSKLPTCKPSLIPTPFPIIIASRKPTPLPTFPPTMNYYPTMSPTISTPFIMVIIQDLIGITNETFSSSEDRISFIKAVVASINSTSVNDSDISLLSVEDISTDTIAVKYQLAFAAGSIASSAIYCSAYLKNLTDAINSGSFTTRLHQYAGVGSALASAYSDSVSMNECSNASPPSYHYVKGPKTFNLSVVGVIVGIIIVVFGCCFLVAVTYYGYHYLKTRINPYDSMDIDELSAKLEMSNKKKNKEFS